MTQEPEITARQAMLRSFLIEQWDLFADHVDRYQWPRESDRWKEFVFCILNWAGQPALKAASARQLVRDLDGFALLEVETLAAQVDSAGQPDFARTDLVVMQQLLQRKGLAPERARAAIAALCQAAFALRERHGGKVQRCLRQFGQQMLDSLVEQFGLAHLGPDAARSILTHWLQNVCNMPLPLRDDAMSACCQQMGVTPEQVLAAADEMDINVALVDDMFDCIPGAVPEPEAVREDR